MQILQCHHDIKKVVILSTFYLCIYLFIYWFSSKFTEFLKKVDS